MATSLPTLPYAEQRLSWPSSGRHILASFDATSIVVYQAYRPEIADYALTHGVFGGPFSFSRMSWVKPNFLWMMYRSSWATGEGQERVLGLRIGRAFFDRVLESAVPSTEPREGYANRAAWQKAVAASDVRLQWDPDHDPQGNKLERRAIQLGLRGAALRSFATHELIEILDLTPFVVEQRSLRARPHWGRLQTPAECVYRPLSAQAAERVRLDS